MQILQLLARPRGVTSYSNPLANDLVAQLVAANPGSSVQVHELTNNTFPQLEPAQLHSLLTPAESRTPEQEAAVRLSDAAIAELLAADTLVIGAPLYNFSIATTLKAWTDHIVRAGITFRNTTVGPEGLVNGKKVYIALSSGGVQYEGPMAAYDFVAPYLQTVLGFLGMTDVTVVREEGQNVPAPGDNTVANAMASINF